MCTSRANAGCILLKMDISAVAADPANGLFSGENLIIEDIFTQFYVAVLVAFLGNGNAAKNLGDMSKTLIISDGGKFRVHRLRFIMLAVGGFL